MKLTERQIELLRDLEYRRDHPCSRQINGQWWATPQDVGGSNGSHHSATLTQLARKGLADRYKLGTFNSQTGERVFNKFNSRAKGSCCFRITEAGLAWLAANPRTPK